MSWFNRFTWIHYDIPRDSDFCFICCKATKEKKLKLNGLTEGTFLSSGYTNWKDATRNFTKHEQCEFHKQVAVVLSKTKDVSEMLSSRLAADKEKNRMYFLKVLSTIRYLARQGLPLRGDDEVELNFLISLVISFNVK